MILQLLNVVIGLTLIYLIFSMIASALFDLIESRVKQRGKLLARGIREILRKLSSRPDADLQRFFDHPLINALFEGEFQGEKRNLPSYIAPERFARVVQMLAEDAAAAGAGKDDAFVRLVECARRLVAQSTSAQGKPQTLESALVSHFNDSMDRVSGWFTRYARRVLLTTGFLLAVAANVDTVQIVQTLSMDPVLADRIAESAGQYVEQQTVGESTASEFVDDLSGQLEILREKSALAETQGVPLGWRNGELALLLDEKSLLIRKLIGVLLTGFSLSFGAAFWFDLMSRLVNLRATIKPSS